MNKNETSTQYKSTLRAKDLPNITLIGVGGVGIDMIDTYMENYNYSIDIISADTDINTLNYTYAPIIDLDKKPIKEVYDDIVSKIKDTDLLVLYGGLGGDTGSTAIPQIAEISKELGINNIGIVSIPFNNDVNKQQIIDKSTKLIKENVCTCITINNFLQQEENNESINKLFFRIL